MDRQHIIDVLRFLGCANIRRGGPDWVMASCPLSRNHKNGRDEHPSFAVRVTSNGRSGWHCFSCGESGTLNGLVYDLCQRGVVSRAPTWIISLFKQEVDPLADLSSKLASVTYWEAPVEVSGVWLSGREPEHRQYALKEKFLDETILDPFKNHTPRSLAYLQGADRKLTLDTIHKWQLGYDSISDRVIIPIRDFAGRLLGYSGRKLPPVDATKYLNMDGFSRDLVLFGEHFRNSNHRRAIVSEGFFDVIFLNQLGFSNCFAIMGIALSPVQTAKIIAWFEEVVLVVHGDSAGIKSEKKIRGQLENDVSIRSVFCDPQQDANSTDPEWLLSRINNNDN